MPNLVEEGVAPTLPTPPRVATASLGVHVVGSEARPNGLIPKGGPGDAGPRLGCVAVEVCLHKTLRAIARTTISPRSNNVPAAIFPAVVVGSQIR